MQKDKTKSIPDDYINVIYNETNKPLTEYPYRLTNYLFQKFKISKGTKLLDVGCGRGEFLNGFIEMGVCGYGVDLTNSASSYCPKAEISQADIENEGLPYQDNTFDVVFSKSVIEHFHNPDILIKEIYRCLKPGGLIITMAPSWEYNHRIYFEDYTHRTPFMISSLGDILKIHGFESVNVIFFKQLPILWTKIGFFMKPVSYLTRIITPRYFSKYSKWIRFSKEIMLLSSAYKPKA